MSTDAQILVVDDDQDIRQFVRAALENEGYHVCTAADGQEALARIAEQQPDLVLLDLVMPGTSGWDLHARLREQRCSIPIVVMSGGSKAREFAETQRVSGYLAKPFAINDLLQTIERCIAAGPADATSAAPNEAAQRFEDFGLGRLFWRIPEALIVADAGSGRIALWNPAAETLFGYTAEEAQSLTVDLLVPQHLLAEHQAGRTHYAETGAGRDIAEGTPLMLLALHKSGQEIPIELTLTPLEDIGVPGRYVLALIRDRGADKQRQEGLRQETRLRQALLEDIVSRSEHFLDQYHHQEQRSANGLAHDGGASTETIAPPHKED